MTFESPAVSDVRRPRIISYFVHFALAFLLPLAVSHVRPTKLLIARERCFDIATATACISGRLLEFWQANGGLPVFGYPLGNLELSVTPEGTFETQYFERARFELHPENQPPHDVMLGRVGAERLGALGPLGGSASESGDCANWAEAEHSVCDVFLSAWRAKGIEIDGQRGFSAAESLALWGYPLSPVVRMGDAAVQWFERARFELRGASIAYGLLGSELAPPIAPPPLMPTPKPKPVQSLPPTPTQAPSATPKPAPTQAPSATPKPAPTQVPTAAATTVAPTAVPASAPARPPTALPASAPPQLPSAPPASVPPQAPTATVKPVPVLAPTPTANPLLALLQTATPVAAPTQIPTATSPPAPAQVPTALPTAVPAQVPTATPSTGVVISQVYGGGGNGEARLRNDFIELYNLGRSEIDMTGWSVQYADATGSGWLITPINGFLFPGQHFLIQEASGGGGSESLPTPDATGNISINQASGKVALVRSTARLGGQCPKDDPRVVDFVGYGTSNCFEGSGPAPQQNAQTAVIRRGEGSVETNDNQRDFATGLPVPRNSGSPFVPTPVQTPTAVGTPAAPTPTTAPSQPTATPEPTATPSGPTATPLPPTATPLPPTPTSGPPPPPPVPSAPFPQAPCDRNVPAPSNGLQIWMADPNPSIYTDAVTCVRMIADNAPVNGANALAFRFIGDQRIPSIPQSTGLDGVASFIFYIGELPPGLQVPVEAVVTHRGTTFTAYTSFTTR